MTILDGDFDEFVGSVRTPSDIQTTTEDKLDLLICLEGHISFARNSNKFRFYFSDVLNTFIDIDRDKVIHFVKTGTDTYTKTILWVKQSSEFTYYNQAGTAIIDKFSEIKRLFSNDTIHNRDSGLSDTCPKKG
jgi:hypothetical protein